MSRRCDICGKGNLYGSTVSHSHNVSKRRWQPNLQRVKVVIDGVPKKIDVCTRCLRSDVVQKSISARMKMDVEKQAGQS